MSGDMRRVDAVLFDKDGTLFDFRLTWEAWASAMIADISGGDTALAARIAAACHFDIETARFAPTSPAIGGSNFEVAELIHNAGAGGSVAEIEHMLRHSAATAPLAEAVPLRPLLETMRKAGLPLGVMTNDAEFTAHAHLTSAGVADQMDFICGYDSGFGAKPDPQPLLAFCDHINVPPERVAMVGDSTHDLIAAQSAGMQRVAVLTGIAAAEELAPYADVILPDIGALPMWIDGAL